MTEFYENLSGAEIEDIIKDKLKIYKEEIEIGRYHDILLSRDSFIYRYYADYYDVEPETFELYRYIGMYNGIQLYHFYVKRDVTEEMKSERKEARKRLLQGFLGEGWESPIRIEFMKMKVEELESELSDREIEISGTEEDKRNALIEYEMQKALKNYN